MKKIMTFIFASFIASTAWAATIVPVQGEALFCTRDYNPWGQAGTCDCPSETSYDGRLGQCVQGEPLAITAEGAMETELSFTGEVLGLILTSENLETYDLVISRALAAKLADFEAKGLKFMVSGELVDTAAAKGGHPGRAKIIVEKISVIGSL